MRSAILTTNPSTEDGTFGVLLLDDHTSFCSGELPDHQNEHGTSRIPSTDDANDGKPYICKWTDSPRHGWCYQITGVINRDMIEIHSANWMADKAICPPKASQLLGCLALGKSVGMMQSNPDAPQQMSLFKSAQAISEFNANMNGEDFELTIIRK